MGPLVMSDIVPRYRERIALLTLFFLVSGATSLIYEVIWLRKLMQVFGATQLASATVLAAFMGGLALGAWVGGRAVDRIARPLVLYGALEVAIGAYALLFPHLMDAGGGLYRQFHLAVEPSFTVGSVFNGVLMRLLLLIPTSCMGATLPALARLATRRAEDAGHEVGRLYAINTAGAVIGVWACGFVLLPGLGLSTTTAVAATCNGLLGITAIAVGWRGELGRPLIAPPSARAAAAPPALDWRVRVIALAFGLSGLCAMTYEVSWHRFLALILGNSVYAFTIMLLAFLIGIAIGAYVGSRLVRRFPIDPHLGAIVCLTGTAAAAFGVHHLFGQMPYWFVELYALVRHSETLLWAMQLGLACVVMLGSTLFSGAFFPIALAAVIRRDERVGSDVGGLYTLNTLGSILGSVLAGFVLIPTLGIQNTLLGTVLIGFAGAGLLAAVWRASWVRRAAVAGVVGTLALISVLIRPVWDPLVMSAGMYKYVADLEEYTREGVRNYAISDYELLFYEEGVTTTVTVARALGDGNIWMANDGKIDASTTVDLPTQVLLGHFGYFFGRDPERVLMVGLASGISAGSAAVYPGPVVDIVEIEEAVVRCSHYFDFLNNRPLERDNVRMIVNDARNHLYLEDEPYDIIINQPSNPWISGVANLYTLDYFELCKQKMTPDGVFVQWMQLYGMGQEDLRTILATLHTAFPYIVLFSSIEEADIVMVASAQPLEFDLAYLQGILETEGPREDLHRVGIDTVEDLLTYYLMDEIDIAEIADGAPLNTDDNMRIEFSSPKYLYYVTEEKNFQMLLEATSGPWRKMEPLIDDPVEKAAFWDRMGKAYAERDQMDRAALAYLRALKLQPDNERYRISAEILLDTLEEESSGRP